MKPFLFAVAASTMLVSSAAAQPTGATTLRVVVEDATGAVLVGAHVTLGALTRDTDARGEAVFEGLEATRVTVHVESTGFEPRDDRNVRLRVGETRRVVKLALARLTATVDVRRDARERGSDPRSDAFATTLSEAQIQELPDDPDEMEQQLKDLAGPGATIRVNGFHGGKLPPKDQIQQIRFRRNMFAADMHEPGFVSVDIVTRPGVDNWRGATNVGFRNAALNARNAFAPVKADERTERAGFSLNGPVWQKHTSVAFSVDGLNAFDSKTIVAALPAGGYAASVRKPTDSMNVTTRLEHALTPSQVFRAELQRNHLFNDNLGVGDFDLPERGYSQQRDEWVLRASSTGALGKNRYNEFRAQWRSQSNTFAPISNAPAVMVLNAFDAGGAQVAGARDSRDFEVADNLDVAVGHHAIRGGLLIEGGRYSDAVRRNSTGTFTFGSLDAFHDGRPTTFTQNIGNAAVNAAQVQAGAYVQDDLRVRKDMTLSVGMRQEWQSHIGRFHLAPRGGIAWSPLRSGRTTLRAGGGVFFDWLEAESYEQALQLDGTHQRIATIVSPGYPDAAAGGQAIVLPSGRVTLAPRLGQPELREAIVGVEQQLRRDVRVNAMYIMRRGANLLRGINVNAPDANGIRPDPSAGTITQIQSSATSAFDGLSINVNYARPERRLFVAANYMLSRSIDESDSIFSLPANSHNLAAERGPALNDARHRAMGMVNAPLWRRLRIASAFRIQSALPYNVITGTDDNHDTVSNDRPAGVTRNSARGAAQIDISARLGWSFGFGPAPTSGPQGPQVHIIRGGDSDPLRDLPGGGVENKRYAVELYAQAYNLLNRINPLNFSGVVTSPFFGRATSALPPRRLEIGARLTF